MSYHYPISAFSPSSVIAPFQGIVAGNLPSILITSGAYLVTTNTLYIARRSFLRKMSKRKLWKIRTTREAGVSLNLYALTLLSWQVFVLLFPVIESIALLCRHVSFFYSYPNAGGVGVIFEPINVQHLNQSKRVKEQIRLDWHRFQVNTGDIGRDGYKHPPALELCLPHVDIPKRGVKHWPWRRRYKVKDSDV